MIQHAPPRAAPRRRATGASAAPVGRASAHGAEAGHEHRRVRRRHGRGLRLRGGALPVVTGGSVVTGARRPRRVRARHAVLSRRAHPRCAGRPRPGWSPPRRRSCCRSCCSSSPAPSPRSWSSGRSCAASTPPGRRPARRRAASRHARDAAWPPRRAAGARSPRRVDGDDGHGDRLGRRSHRSGRCRCTSRVSATGDRAARAGRTAGAVRRGPGGAGRGSGARPPCGCWPCPGCSPCWAPPCLLVGAAVVGPAPGRRRRRPGRAGRGRPGRGRATPTPAPRPPPSPRPTVPRWILRGQRRRRWWRCGCTSRSGSARSASVDARARPARGPARSSRPAAAAGRRLGVRPARTTPSAAAAVDPGVGADEAGPRRGPRVARPRPASLRRPVGAARPAPRRAPAPRPPCPAGRCRCRTWATARTTGSRSRTRSWPPSPGSPVSQSRSTANPRSAKPAPPGCPS